MQNYSMKHGTDVELRNKQKELPIERTSHGIGHQRSTTTAPRQLDDNILNI